MIPPRKTLLQVFGMSAVVGILVGCSQPPSVAGGQTPVSVVASTTGRFAEGYSWHLSVSAERKARLTIDAYPRERIREFEISANQINELAEALERERFFGLRSDYGEEVVDGSTDTIKIAKGGVTHTVRIHFLMNWVYSDPAKLKEPARAVRVFNVVRGWFDDKGTVDLKKYDDIVLEAAGKGG